MRNFVNAVWNVFGYSSFQRILACLGFLLMFVGMGALFYVGAFDPYVMTACMLCMAILVLSSITMPEKKENPEKFLDEVRNRLIGYSVVFSLIAVLACGLFAVNFASVRKNIASDAVENVQKSYQKEDAFFKDVHDLLVRKHIAQDKGNLKAVLAVLGSIALERKQNEILYSQLVDIEISEDRLFVIAELVDQYNQGIVNEIAHVGRVVANLGLNNDDEYQAIAIKHQGFAQATNVLEMVQYNPLESIYGAWAVILVVLWVLFVFALLTESELRGRDKKSAQVAATA
jgi:hypothetical protein